MSDWVDILIVAAALGAALMAGTFFSFSNFIMRALAMRPLSEGIGAMQAIDVTVLNPGFLGIFMGTAGLGAGLVVIMLTADDPRRLFVIAGAVAYIVGTFGVTMVRNVPMNNELAKAAPTGSASERLWARYLRDWTYWNSVRTVAALVATAGLMLGLAS